MGAKAPGVWCRYGLTSLRHPVPESLFQACLSQEGEALQPALLLLVTLPDGQVGHLLTGADVLRGELQAASCCCRAGNAAPQCLGWSHAAPTGCGGLLVDVLLDAGAVAEACYWKQYQRLAWAARTCTDALCGCPSTPACSNSRADEWDLRDLWLQAGSMNRALEAAPCLHASASASAAAASCCICCCTAATCTDQRELNG